LTGYPKDEIESVMTAEDRRRAARSTIKFNPGSDLDLDLA